MDQHPGSPSLLPGIQIKNNGHPDEKRREELAPDATQSAGDYFALLQRRDKNEFQRSSLTFTTKAPCRDVGDAREQHEHEAVQQRHAVAAKSLRVRGHAG